jgi:hypothetical protein
MADTFQHANKPKPQPDETNALVDVVIPDGKGGRFIEKAPVPETHPGGRYINTRGQVVNAHGQPFEFDEEESPDPGELTYEQALALEGPDSPIVQHLKGRKLARERAAKKKAQKLAEQAEEPAMLPEDIAAKRAREADPNAKPKL